MSAAHSHTHCANSKSTVAVDGNGELDLNPSYTMILSILSIRTEVVNFSLQ